jgi:hypothetical protein
VIYPHSTSIDQKSENNTSMISMWGAGFDFVESGSVFARRQERHCGTAIVDAVRQPGQDRLDSCQVPDIPWSMSGT